MVLEEKVTRDALRTIMPGRSITFTGLKANEIESGKVTATQMGRLMECKFTCATDYEGKKLTITREA